jgi:hypothetical protein
LTLERNFATRKEFEKWPGNCHWPFTVLLSYINNIYIITYLTKDSKWNVKIWNSWIFCQEMPDKFPSNQSIFILNDC